MLVSASLSVRDIVSIRETTPIQIGERLRTGNEATRRQYGNRAIAPINGRHSPLSEFGLKGSSMVVTNTVMS
ncbi:hypothetical protein BOC60_00265 [Burkholderia pseudomallei]|nr:hypothetical protein BK015_04785 [Burkholderia pseudomallei]ARK38767.1 hypothetical protein BOC60_00265 [Burkholderia pseudomallei]